MSTDRPGPVAVVFSQSRSKAAFRSIASACLVWCCWWGGSQLPPLGEVALRTCAAILALNVVLMAWVVVNPGSLRLSEAGLEWTAWWVRRSLPWSTIDNVFKGPIAGVFVQARDRPFPVGLSSYAVSAEELEKAINAWRRPEATANLFE